MPKKLPKNLFKNIIDFKLDNNLQGDSLLQIITTYCDKYSLDPIEVGETLKKDKKFVEMFKQDLIKNYEARFSGDTEQVGVNEWF